MSNEVFEGKIDARSKDGGGIMIGNTWYNTPQKGIEFPADAQPGAQVKFQFEKNGRYNNVIQGRFKVVQKADPNYKPRGGGGGGGRGRSPEERNEIASQNALTNAVTLISSANLDSSSLNDAIGMVIKAQRAFFDAVKATAKSAPLGGGQQQQQKTQQSSGGDWDNNSGGGDWDSSAPPNTGQSGDTNWDDDIPF